MQMTCPHCGFSKQIDPEQLPPDVTRVNCPKCKQSFPLPQQPAPQPEITVKKYQSSANQTEVDALPKAGFWMRLVATFIDAFIVFVLQFLLGSLLAVAGLAVGENTMGNMAILIQLFGFVLSFAYYVFFTGYCGQTPGKMALRIKVIRRDGTTLSYGRAAFREIPAKFISGIIFGIGYLMVAFDDQKQGLHDRMADTYVIKL
ncbi:MAG: RDD family protein [Thermodesulfobacteriota bacterium]|nr:RDD family protein [Thermodesulfobacteriota bacterium]